VNVFRAPEGFLIALTYGPNSEWVRNEVATAGCQLDPTRRRFPLSVRMILLMADTNDFMRLSNSHAHGDPS
jgi:hypothetical protein